MLSSKDMYYYYNCPYCQKTFYVFSDSKEEAAKELFEGISKHEHDYGEDAKDETLTKYDPETETNMIYSSLQESEEIPAGGYPLE
jgi:hypothetical protein